MDDEDAGMNASLALLGHRETAFRIHQTKELLNRHLFKPPSTATKSSIVGGGTHSANDARSCISLNPNPFTPMRLVEERSLSSILRSNLLTTFINNDVSGKVNASGLRECFGQI
jgi:hypothetical protein